MRSLLLLRAVPLQLPRVPKLVLRRPTRRASRASSPPVWACAAAPVTLDNPRPRPTPIPPTQHRVGTHGCRQHGRRCWPLCPLSPQAKTIDLCNNPLTKEPKLQSARRIIAEWPDLDREAAEFTASVGRVQVGAGRRDVGEHGRLKEACERGRGRWGSSPGQASGAGACLGLHDGGLVRGGLGRSGHQPEGACVQAPACWLALRAPHAHRRCWPPLRSGASGPRSGCGRRGAASACGCSPWWRAASGLASRAMQRAHKQRRSRQTQGLRSRRAAAARRTIRPSSELPGRLSAAAWQGSGTQRPCSSLRAAYSLDRAVQTLPAGPVVDCRHVFCLPLPNCSPELRFLSVATQSRRLSHPQ